jgi:hypothetical protein
MIHASLMKNGGQLIDRYTHFSFLSVVNKEIFLFAWPIMPPDHRLI